MSDTTLLLLAGATALNGILAGASLDQSIKQLPSRHRIGPVAYSTYSRASDLGNGIPWYVIFILCRFFAPLGGKTTHNELKTTGKRTS